MSSARSPVTTGTSWRASLSLSAATSPTRPDATRTRANLWNRLVLGHAISDPLCAHVNHPSSPRLTRRFTLTALFQRLLPRVVFLLVMHGNPCFAGPIWSVGFYIRECTPRKRSHRPITSRVPLSGRGMGNGQEGAAQLTRRPPSQQCLRYVRRAQHTDFSHVLMVLLIR